MGTDHPSMKLALVFLQKCPDRDLSVQLKSGFCSSLKELIKYLHDLMGTDGVSILAMEGKVVSCAMIQQGLLAGSTIRDSQVLEGSDTALPSCSDSLWSWLFQFFYTLHLQTSLSCCWFLRNQRGQFGRGRTKPFTAPGLSLVCASLTCTFPFSCLEINVCMKPLALNT